MAGVMKILDKNVESYSSEQIEKLIRQLNQAKRKAVKREKEEEERKAKEEEERRAREEEAQKAMHIREVTSMDLPLAWENLFNTDERTQGVHTDSIPDALILSLTTLGRVDIEYMSAVTGEDYKTVISTLKGSIYQNPDTWEECFYKGWETAEEYLSGKLMRKWKAAKAANETYDGYFSDNIKAIEKVLPPNVATKDIYVTLGSPWVPADVIDDFIVHLFGDPMKGQWFECVAERRWVQECPRNDCSNYKCLYRRTHDDERLVMLPDYFKTIHDEYTGTWEIPNKSRYHRNLAVRSVYGTKRMEALHILEKTLNMKALVVKDDVNCPTNKSGKKRVINQSETIAVMEKQKLMIQEFQKWVWKDPARKERLEMIFENQYSCMRRRIFDGSFLTFPGMDKSVQLYPYQKDAVARILFSPNTLLAHEVGSGKTYIMIAAGQELRRMKLSKKNLYVVPNNIVGQWENIFRKMYPNADLLTVTPRKFTPSKRERVLEDIRDHDYDGIIMAYSCFELIPLSKECYLEEMEKKKQVIEKLLTTRGKATASLKKKHDAVNETLDRLKHTIDDLYDQVYFDDLGITRLFVDEAHNYKNVPLETKIDAVLGISRAGSKRCQDMMDKVHMVQRRNEGKGVVLATGTPITNSITDVYVMQRYLQEGELGLLDLQSFDGWVGMFAERVTEFEVDVDTTQHRMATRFTKFHNLPELTGLLCSIADFHQVDRTAGLPECDGRSDALIPKTQEFADYLDDISFRADQVRHGSVSRRDDNMLKITTDGRKAALDMRLVDPMAMFTYQSKVARCAENVADIFYKTLADRSTQLVFCDSSTPKSGFNLYDELKDRLVQLGIPRAEIAFIHDAETEKLREALFGRVRSGEVRVLIGSTFKLGLGVNVQDRLIALHHLDVPWRPADMTQREGRILRQGNTNPKVQIFRYITEGSFDAYSWQLLETKQRFINAILSGSMEERSMSDVEDTALDYAEVKALAIGNPLIKKRFETANELERFRTLQRKTVEERLRMEKELSELPGEIRRKEEQIGLCRKDIAFVRDWSEAHLAVGGAAEGAADGAADMPNDGPVGGSTDGPADGPNDGPASGSADEPTDGPKDGPDGVTDGSADESADGKAKKKSIRKREAEFRKQFRETLDKAIKENVLETRERRFTDYRGFELILPANMLREKPYIWLRKNGKYRVELGDTEVGNLIRIDHFMDSLDEYMEKLQKALNGLQTREHDLKTELAKSAGYTKQIEILRKELEDIDRKLGVEK